GRGSQRLRSGSQGPPPPGLPSREHRRAQCPAQHRRRGARDGEGHFAGDARQERGGCRHFRQALRPVLLHAAGGGETRGAGERPRPRSRPRTAAGAVGARGGGRRPEARRRRAHARQGRVDGDAQVLRRGPDAPLQRRSWGRRADAALDVLAGVDPEPQAGCDGERPPAPHLPHAPPPLAQHVQPGRPRAEPRRRGDTARRDGGRTRRPHRAPARARGRRGDSRATGGPGREHPQGVARPHKADAGAEQAPQKGRRRRLGGAAAGAAQDAAVLRFRRAGDGGGGAEDSASDPGGPDAPPERGPHRAHKRAPHPAPQRPLRGRPLRPRAPQKAGGQAAGGAPVRRVFKHAQLEPVLATHDLPDAVPVLEGEDVRLRRGRGRGDAGLGRARHEPGGGRDLLGPHHRRRREQRLRQGRRAVPRWVPADHKPPHDRRDPRRRTQQRQVGEPPSPRRDLAARPPGRLDHAGAPLGLVPGLLRHAALRADLRPRRGSAYGRATRRRGRGPRQGPRV
ncbi:MAG: Carbon monoxide oxidation accessory protein CoxE, partial [uncultured Rubrobacteraceae bacterium]